MAADAAIFDGWPQARAADDPELQAIFVRRFSPEHRTAFAAWLEREFTRDR